MAKRIEEFSAKYAAGNQLGVILNKVDNSALEHVYRMLKRFDLEVLGVIPFDNDLKQNAMSRESVIIQNAIKQFYYRLNLPQSNSENA